MNSKRLTITFLSYWHAGSGEGRGAAADALCLKDAAGLPYLPGKTIKGLLREAVHTCEDAGRLDTGTTDFLFGKAAVAASAEKKIIGEASVPGILRVSNANLPEREHQWLASPSGEGQRHALFEYFSATSIDEHGLALDKTLRTIELCLPVTLLASITGPDDDRWVEPIKTACVLIRSAGSHRNRGLGRCTFTFERNEEMK